jgi:uncharacterized protein (DUF1800 family)
MALGCAAGLLAAAAVPAGAQTGALSSLIVANLSPAFSPGVTQYSVPRTTSCSVAVTATLADTSNRLYIQSTETASGATRQAWVCDGRTKIEIVVYKVWTEAGRYTISVVDGMGTTTTTTGSTTTTTPTPATEPTPQPAPAPVPYSGPLPAPLPTDGPTALRLLEQGTFGPTAAGVALVKANGVDHWFAQQWTMPETSIPDGLDNNQLRAHVFLSMANAPDQLRQRVAFALSQTLVVSTAKNVNGFEMIPWVRLLSRHAFGNYRTLLREVALSPSMGKYLDLANSRKAMNGSAPNENFPRELMQLFTIGLWKLNQDGTYEVDGAGQLIPTYTQKDVTEVARALTGWTYPTKPGATPLSANPEYFVGLMEPRPASHDTGAKALPGAVTLPANQTVTKDLDDVIDALFQHPNTPPFVATRLIRSLASSNPSPGFISRVADVFVNNGQGERGDLAAVVKAILTDPEGSIADPAGGRLKDPILLVIGLGRALGAQITDPNMFMYVLGNLGQAVLSPPTVFSFYSPLASLPHHPDLVGPEFQIYSPALAIQRANFVYAILNGEFSGSFKVDLLPFTAVAGDPAALVEKVNQTLLLGRMSPELRQIITSATKAASDSRQRALGALYLAAISAEFAVHTAWLP